jgi:hypothetical protein
MTLHHSDTTDGAERSSAAYRALTPTLRGAPVGVCRRVWASDQAVWCLTQASMKLAKRGWGLVGRLLNSGWNWQPTYQG